MESVRTRLELVPRVQISGVRSRHANEIFASAKKKNYGPWPNFIPKKNWASNHNSLVLKSSQHTPSRAEGIAMHKNGRAPRPTARPHCTCVVTKISGPHGKLSVHSGWQQPANNLCNHTSLKIKSPLSDTCKRPPDWNRSRICQNGLTSCTWHLRRGHLGNGYRWTLRNFPSVCAGGKIQFHPESWIFRIRHRVALLWKFTPMTKTVFSSAILQPWGPLAASNQQVCNHTGEK